jgi:hypothetical protein
VTFAIGLGSPANSSKTLNKFHLARRLEQDSLKKRGLKYDSFFQEGSMISDEAAKELNKEMSEGLLEQ